MMNTTTNKHVQTQTTVTPRGSAVAPTANETRNRHRCLVMIELYLAAILMANVSVHVIVWYDKSMMGEGIALLFALLFNYGLAMIGLMGIPLFRDMKFHLPVWIHLLLCLGLPFAALVIDFILFVIAGVGEGEDIGRLLTASGLC